MKFLETINEQIKKRIVPEFGAFAPISSIIELKDKSRFTFTIQPLDASDTGKKATFAFLNFSNGKLAVKTKKFPSKQEFEAYINSLKEEDVQNILSEFKQKTR